MGATLPQILRPRSHPTLIRPRSTYNPIGAAYTRLLHDPNLPLERRRRMLARINRHAPGFLAELADRYKVFPESPFFLPDQVPVRYNFELDDPLDRPRSRSRSRRSRSRSRRRSRSRSRRRLRRHGSVAYCPY